MSIPDIIEAKNISQGSNTPHGIVHTIRQKVTDNAILNFVFPSTNTPNPDYDVTSVVKLNGKWQSEKNKNAYFQIEFKNRYLHPTHYSLKGFKDRFFC